MAKKFSGMLDVYFETEEDVHNDTFVEFKKEYIRMLHDTFSDALIDLAEEYGIKILDPWPITEDESNPLQASDK